MEKLVEFGLPIANRVAVLHPDKAETNPKVALVATISRNTLAAVNPTSATKQAAKLQMEHSCRAANLVVALPLVKMAAVGARCLTMPHLAGVRVDKLPTKFRIGSPLTSYAAPLKTG